MMHQTTAEDLQRLWEEAVQKEQMLEEELAEVREEKAAYVLIMTRNAVRDSEAGRSQLYHAHIDPRVLRGSRTQAEAFERIAERSDGIVRVGEASRLVHAAGLAKGKVSSVNSSMSAQLGRSPNWEWVAAGTYRWLHYESSDDGDLELDDNGGEECPGEPCPTDTGDASDPSSPVRPETPDVLGRITV